MLGGLDANGTDTGALDPELVAHLVLGSAEQLARLTLSDAERYSPQRLAGFVGVLIAVLATGRCDS